MSNRILIISLCFLSVFVGKAQDATDQKKFKISFSERLRLTTVDKAITLDKNKEVLTFSRWRTYLGAEYRPIGHIEMKLELANEARIWISPVGKSNTLDELFVNQLYIDYRNVAGLPVDLKIGRQNIIFDEGFICLDGQPLTGSRSNYFNAIKGVYRINEKNRLTAFFSYNTQKEELLPIIHENKPPQPLEEQTNRGVGLYYNSKLQEIGLSAYYFYKHYLENEKYPDGKTHAVGARVAIPFLQHFAFISEFACQFGKSGDFNRQGYGGYSRLEYHFDPSIPFFKKLYAGGYYLSGDDPKTEKIEAWDPLWSRWPKWGESYIYTLILENRGKVAYWSNINSLNLGLKTAFTEKVSLDVDFHHLSAFEENTTDFCSGSGKTRGELLITKLGYTIDRNWSGHFLLEHFKPGNYYFKDASKYNWIRFELMYKF